MALAARKHRAKHAGSRDGVNRALADLWKARLSAERAAGIGDYAGVTLAAWKAALSRDVEERFGKTPDDLLPVGKPGW